MPAARRHALTGAGPLLLLLLLLLLVHTEATDITQQARPRVTSWDKDGNNISLLRLAVRPVAGDRTSRPSVLLARDSLIDGDGSPGYGLRVVNHRDFEWVDKFLAARESLVTNAELVAGGDRFLQTQQCATGDDFTVVSSLYPAANGCYYGIEGDVDRYVTVEFDRFVAPVPAVVSSSSVSTTQVFWGAGKILQIFTDGTVSLDVECLSNDPWTAQSHPDEVSLWLCYVGGTFFPVVDSAFGTDCGCSSESSGTTAGGTPAPAAAAIPSDSPTATGSAGDSSGCAESTIAVSSTQLEEFEGCYTSVAVDGSMVYTLTGDFGDGSPGVFPAYLDQEQTDARWVVGTMVTGSDGDTIDPICISEESALNTHPVDSTWACALTGTGAFAIVSDAQFKVDCGCEPTATASSATSSSPGARSNGAGTDAPSGTPSPNPSEDVDAEPFANGGGSERLSKNSSVLGLAVAALVVGRLGASAFV